MSELHKIELGRWCLSFRRFPGYRCALRRGGRYTRYPWWSLTVRWVGEFVLSYERR